MTVFPDLNYDEMVLSSIFSELKESGLIEVRGGKEGPLFRLKR